MVVVTKQGTDITQELYTLARKDAAAFLAMLIAESNLNETAKRDGVWPDKSGGLSQVIASNLGYKQTDDLTSYWNYMFNPHNAMVEGWKYLNVALQRMGGDHLMGLISYNMGGKYTKQQLQGMITAKQNPAYAHYMAYLLAYTKAGSMLMNIEWIPSPNFENVNIQVRGICDHVMDGTMASAVAWFQNPASQVSAHYLVGLDGRVVNMVPVSAGATKKAWAQGITTPGSQWTPIVPNGANPNNYLVSIEHEGHPFDANFMNDKQYAASLELHRMLVGMFHIPVDADHIVGHYRFDHINRANCPGPKFPFQRLFTDIPNAAEDPAMIQELQKQLQDMTGQRDQFRGIADDLGKQLDNCQKLKFEVEDRLSRQVGDLQGQVQTLSAQVAALTAQVNTNPAAKRLADIKVAVSALATLATKPLTEVSPQ